MPRKTHGDADPAKGPHMLLSALESFSSECRRGDGSVSLVMTGWMAGETHRNTRKCYGNGLSYSTSEKCQSGPFVGTM